MGGLGFRKMRWNNQALLTKHAWRFLNDYESLLSRVFVLKHYQIEGFLTVQTKQSSSWAWKSILQGSNLLLQGLETHLGINKMVFFIDEQGVDNPFSSLVSPTDHTWKLPTTNSDERRGLEKHLLGKSFFIFWGKDKIEWKHTNNDVYSVSYGYQVLAEEGKANVTTTQSWQPSLCRIIWSLKILAKLSLFCGRFWRIVCQYEIFFLKRNILVCSICKLCQDEEEMIDHLFFKCGVAKLVWLCS